jgi:cytochrome c biogenesis protein CcmG/thiol:disulfide interchange protein DsbE
MNWKRLILPLAGIPVVALLGYGLTRDAKIVPSPLPGRLAPEFTLETLEGDTLRLSDLRGHVVMLNFWASWCLACIDEHPLMVAAAERWQPEGLRVVGVVYQDVRQNARDWMREKGGDWSNVLDEGSRTAISYGLFGVPETYLIDRRGVIAYKQIGPVTPAVLSTWIPRLLADSTGSTAQSEPAGGRSEGHVSSGPEFPDPAGTRTSR